MDDQITLREFSLEPKDLIIKDVDFEEYSGFILTLDSRFQMSEIVCSTYSFTEGWHLIDTKLGSASDISNSIIHYFAGVLEGFTTKKTIDNHYFNVYNTNFKSAPFNPRLENFMSNQYQFTLTVLERNDEDKLYQESASYSLAHFSGIVKGYKLSSSLQKDEQANNLTTKQIYHLTMLADLEDLVPGVNNTQSNLSSEDFHQELKFMECTIILKVVENDLLIAHNTHNVYSLMTKFFKTYDLGLVSEVDPSRKIFDHKYSSRAADLNSKDDFYVTSSNLVIMETSLQILDSTLYNYLNVRTVPKWLRNAIANKLATNGEEWIKLFMKYNSGTHNNQWVIIDVQKYLSKSQEGVMYLLEQYPSPNLYYEDLTQVLYSQGHFAAYNTPYFEETYELSGYKAAHWSRFNETSRYHIITDFFQQNAKSEITTEQMKYLIRYFNEDNLCDTVSPRCDVYQNPFGGIDAKVLKASNLKQVNLILGPAFTESISRFCFSKDFPNYPHKGIQDCFENKWIVKLD